MVERCIAWFSTGAGIKTIQARASSFYIWRDEQADSLGHGLAYAVWLLAWDYFWDWVI
jgi:hypothetical protein